MATYRVWHAAAGAANGTSWTDAFTTLQAALTAASSNGDVILVHYAHQQTAAGVILTAAARITIVSVNKDSSDAPTVMGGSGYIESTTTMAVSSAASSALRIWGLTILINSASSRIFALSANDESHVEYESCRLGFSVATGASSTIAGPSSTDRQNFVRLRNCTVLFTSTGSSFTIASRMLIEGGEIEIPAGSAPSVLFNGTQSDPGGATVSVEGMDLSALGSGTLVGANSAVAGLVSFTRCKLGSSYVAYTASPAPTNLSGLVCHLRDCSSGDTHGVHEYHDALGSCVTDTSITYTGGAAGQSWKITTTANASAESPFRTPWIDLYHTGTSSITPRLEILRNNDSTSAWNNDEVWGEFSAKVTGGTPNATFYNDRVAILGTPAAQANGAGTGSWGGESGSCWSGLVDTGAAITPAEAGHIRGRVAVGLASIAGKLHVDPQIRF